jgi:glycosyltransferase involved in cell wall biosynthesis
MVGTYNLSNYPRARILFHGLLQNKINVDLLLLHGVKEWIKLCNPRYLSQFNYIVVTGKPILCILSFLRFFYKFKIIFDVFISDYDNLVNDRKIISEKSLFAKFLWFSDKLSCQLADYNLLDTHEHISYFQTEFGLFNRKFYEIEIGADETIFKPNIQLYSKKFIIAFHGTFIPLQGIQYILEAAFYLQYQKDIEFWIIGKGQTYSDMIDIKERYKLSNVIFLGKINIKELPSILGKADICLGIFSSGHKTNIVIPNKAYEIIAIKKPLITGDTPAINSKFNNNRNCYLCKTGSGLDLFKAIISLKNNPHLRKKIALGGYHLFVNKFTSYNLGRKFKNLILTQFN